MCKFLIWICDDMYNKVSDPNIYIYISTSQKEEKGRLKFVLFQVQYVNFVEVWTGHTLTSDVYWILHHSDDWRTKNQLDAIYYLIVLLIGSTCFGHYYAHHQELATMMLIITLVVNANPSIFTERNDQCGNQHHSRELPMMGIVVPETCWAYKKYNKIISDI